MSENLDLIVKERAEKWLSDSYDEETRKKVKQLIDNDPKELTESFYKDLEFGTGGLRGIMGVGTNRMNVYTVGMATQGLSNYLKKAFPDEPIRVAVGHDSRNNSRLFAERVADIFAANGIQGLPVRLAEADPGAELRDTSSPLPQRRSGHRFAQSERVQRIQGLLVGRRSGRCASTTATSSPKCRKSRRPTKS